MNASEIFIIGSAIVAIIFGLINALMIMKIEIISRDDEVLALRDDKQLEKF